MSQCTAYNAVYRNGEHRFEFIEEKEGLRWWKCLDCAELTCDYHDVGAGG